MNQVFQGWHAVAEKLEQLASEQEAIAGCGAWLNPGQRASVRAVASRLLHNGVILADEVGMGKTRIAVAVIRATVAAGGRVAILVPPGLGYQWQDELSAGANKAKPLLRSLWQYLSAWSAAPDAKDKPWFDESVVMLSHGFANWRLGKDSAPWRWALLPEVYARWRKQTSGRLPRGYWQDEIRNEPCIQNAARSICNAIPNETLHPLYKQMETLIGRTPWPGALEASAYQRDQLLRPCLEEVVGLGLGYFDLIVVDEAHKSRGQDSTLSKVLERLIQVSTHGRRLAMTATPVELDVGQWRQILARIRIEPEALQKIDGAVTAYGQAVQQVRASPGDATTRAGFANAAASFKHALSPYVLRRDKRQDPAVQQFANATGLLFDAYRQERDIAIQIASLAPAWQQAVCAAEALSVVTIGLRDGDNEQLKRLRLTLGNGHGLAAMIDTVQHVAGLDDEATMVQDANSLKIDQVSEAAADSKRLQRAQWWRAVMQQPFVNQSGDEMLYNHPTIVATVTAIEVVTELGEKVLVFGRFTRPLTRLVQLLNARAMLRAIDAGQFWPQAKVSGDPDGSADQSDWPAVRAAYQQMQLQKQLPSDLVLTTLDEKLAAQYRELRNRRQSQRNALPKLLEESFRADLFDARTARLYCAFRTAMGKQDESDDDTHLVALVSRALTEQLGDSAQQLDPPSYAKAFADLMLALCDRSEDDEDAEKAFTEDEANALWSVLQQRLKEEYGGAQGTFARLMYGNTRQHSRRIMQLAFNRVQSSIKVLVAQSMVGREGLNLHEACKTVILFHPEWNPGVVEQQIGRVDRVGSLWQQELVRAIERNVTQSAIPRIDVRAVIFEGTYDEYNWQVLRTRWANLRAQLHGIVLAHGDRDDPEMRGFLDEISRAAPNFLPS